MPSPHTFMFLSPLGERLGEGVQREDFSRITPSPSLSPKGAYPTKKAVRRDRLFVSGSPPPYGAEQG